MCSFVLIFIIAFFFNLLELRISEIWLFRISLHIRSIVPLVSSVKVTSPRIIALILIFIIKRSFRTRFIILLELVLLVILRWSTSNTIILLLLIIWSLTFLSLIRPVDSIFERFLLHLFLAITKKLLRVLVKWVAMVEISVVPNSIILTMLLVVNFAIVHWSLWISLRVLIIRLGIFILRVIVVILILTLIVDSIHFY